MGQGRYWIGRGAITGVTERGPQFGSVRVS